MTKAILFYRNSLLTKVFMLVILLVGGGNSAWGEGVTYFDGNSDITGWSKTTFYYSAYSKMLSLSGSSGTLISNDKISLSTTRNLIINATRFSSSFSGQKIDVYYSDDKVTWTNAIKFDESLDDTKRDYVIDNISGSYYIKLECAYVKIYSVKIVENSTLYLSIYPDEDVDFGTVWTNATKTDYYTITNNSESSVNVVAAISGTDAASFSVSPSEAQDIAAGGTQTYTISYTYNSNSLGEKNASITFTPDDDETNAITKNISATAVSDNAPKLTITPDEDTNLGNVYSGSTTYTVTNTGTGSMTVNIASDNSDFALDKTTIENLAHDESETFTVTYTFAATVEKLGLNSANITVTPTYDVDDAKTYAVSATSNATMTLDEDNPTTVNYGSKTYLHVKYTPSEGWNTISMPFVLRNTTMDNMSIIFGDSWNAYTLSSYNNGTLTFSKVSSSAVVNNAIPYLVYIASAPSHPNGVLLSDISTTGNTAGSTVKSDATFQGTYVTKSFVENDNWYGVTPAGKVMKAGTGASVKGYRAYFTGVSAPAGARINIVLDEGDGETTDLGFVKMVDPEAKEVYNLKGQRVQKGSKGIYIVNGRKVVIK